MSMWRIGRESVRIGEPVLTPLDRSVAYTRAAADGTGGPLGDIADTVAKWIPGEVLALYVAGVTMIGTPNVFWLVIGILLAPLVVVLAAYANSGKLPADERIQGRAGLALIAMLLWTLVVPNSGWWAWDVIGDNPEAVALAGGALGLVFGLVAEGTARWMDSQAAKPAVSAPQGNAWAPAYQPPEPIEPATAEPGPQAAGGTAVPAPAPVPAAEQTPPAAEAEVQQPMRETTEPVMLPEDDPTEVVRTDDTTDDPTDGDPTDAVNVPDQPEPKRRRRPPAFRPGGSGETPGG
jgi:hypothetical protein